MRSELHWKEDARSWGYKLKLHRMRNRRTATLSLASGDKHVGWLGLRCSEVAGGSSLSGSACGAMFYSLQQTGTVSVSSKPCPCFVLVRSFQAALCLGQLFRWIWKMLRVWRALLAERNFQADSVKIFKAVCGCCISLFFFINPCE